MRLGPQTWYKTKDVSCPMCQGTGKVIGNPRLVECPTCGGSGTVAVRDRGAVVEPPLNTDSYGHETLSTQDTAKTLAELDDGAEHLPEHLYDSEPTSLEGGCSPSGADELSSEQYRDIYPRPKGEIMPCGCGEKQAHATSHHSLEGEELEYLLTFYVAGFGADLLRLKTNEKADGGDNITALRNGIVERLMALVGDVKAQSYKQGQRDAIRSVIEAFSGEHPSSIVTGFVQEELQPWLKKRLDELNQGEEEDESI